jgi:hypothetical protein
MKYTVTDGDTERTIEAGDEYEAAEKWASEHDRQTAEFLVAGGYDAELTVTDCNDGVWCMVVSGYFARQYHARKVG